VTPPASAPVVEHAEAWHALPVDEVGRRTHTEPGRGLGGTEVARRLTQHGPDTLTETAARSLLAIASDQFKSLIVVLVLAATGVALILDESKRPRSSR
jgi:Ca2+-transporting ATPase